MIAINIGTYEVPEWVDLAVGGSGGGLPIITAGSAGKVVAVKTDESGYELVSSGSSLSQYIKTITKSTNSITWKNKDDTTDTFSVDFSNYQTLINATNKLSFSYLKDLPTTLAGYGITDAFTKTEIQDGYQAKALLTAFQATPDDTHYISEKLAYDQFNLKEAKGNKTNLIYDNKTSSDKYPNTKGVYQILTGNVDINITNGHIEIVAFGGIKHKFKIVPDSGYMLPDSITFADHLYSTSYDKTTGIVSFIQTQNDSTITINCPKYAPDFLNCTWNEIAEKCNALENGTITTTEFCASFKNGTTAITSMDGFVGLERKVTINSVEHTVRVIGTQHDTLSSDNSKKAALTFEFKQLLSDSDGYSLGIVWNDTNTTSTANRDYINSSIRKALCGSGNFSGDILYAQKGATSFSATYKNRTILSMLPSDLVAVLKTTKKSVGIGESYTETSYTDKLFMLSPIEMGYTSQYDKGFGTTYKYYENATAQTEAIRIKKQVNNSEVSTSSSQIPSGSGQVYANKVYNYAGYNHKTDNTGGGYYWYRSPYSYRADDAWGCNFGGDCRDYAYYRALGVAPAFCI